MIRSPDAQNRDAHQPPDPSVFLLIHPVRQRGVKWASIHVAYLSQNLENRKGPSSGGVSKDGPVQLPVMPPVAPMLAKPVDDIPLDHFYEPKWDGFRSIVFRDGDEVEIGSRNERPMTRYFPDVVAAVKETLPPRCVIDGEIVVASRDNKGLDFWSLQQRIHPAVSRVQLLAEQTPARFIAFDLLALDELEYMSRPFHERRGALERALSSVALRSTSRQSPGIKT
jgi:ATP-dependent DNA ligase